MTILTYTQSSFLNGELSSGYVSRNDMSARSNGLAVLQNAHTTPDGGIRRRPGLKYVSSLSSTGRLFSYTLKSNDIYLLVLCQRKMEIYKNDELITTLITPYTADQINQIQTSQNIDEMIFTHVNHAPRTLSFDKNDGFIFKLVSWTKDSDGAELHPYFKFPDTKDVSLTPSAGTGEIILSANKEIFNNSFMNMTLKINDGVVRILNIQNPKTARALVLKTISTLTASSSYYEPAFSDIRGYPKTSCFHQGRLIFAGTLAQPNKVWFSKTHDYYNFDFGQGIDDEAIEFSLLSSGTEEIQTLYSSLHLQILTYSGEWVVNADHITPSSVAITKQTGIGSPTDIYLPVTQIETATIFISKDKKEVREFVYGEVLGNYTSNNLSQLSPHLIRDPIDIEYNKTINQLYIALSNGQLAVLTVIPQNQVLSWSVYETLGKFLSCKTIDKEIYFLIERNEKYFLEKFEEGLWTDCCISKTFDNDEERIIQNPNIYFDKEIYIKTDDYVFSKKPFEGQNIALPIKTKTVSFGYPYKHTLTPFTLTKMQGDSYKKYRLIQLSIKLLDTPVLELDTGFGLDVIYLCPMNYGQGLKDFTGDYFINTLGYKSYANDALWKIQSDFPFDFNMQSISLKIKAI